MPLARGATCRGLSLVELLVSMAVGLIIMSGVITVMVDSKESLVTEEQISYIQDNARFALEQLSYDIRMAGYFGCSTQGELTNSVNNSTNDANWMYSSTGIKGFEYSELGDSDFPAELSGDISANTDVVVINRGEPNDSLSITSHVPAAATIHLSEPSTLEVGQILVIASPNCSNMAIFQMTGPTNTTSPSEANHNTGGSVQPGNCRKALTSGYDCSNPPIASFYGTPYPPGSTLMEFSSNAYFIRASETTGLPSLYRQTLIVDSGSNADTEAQELASGVEDLQIIYGLDTDATADGKIDRYYSADNIPYDLADPATGYIAWDRVIAVRITLIMRSAREVFASDTAVDLNEGFVYNDRYMRQKVSTTLRIRNRGLAAEGA